MQKEKSFPKIDATFGMQFPLTGKEREIRARCRKGLPRLYPAENKQLERT